MVEPRQHASLATEARLLAGVDPGQGDDLEGYAGARYMINEGVLEAAGERLRGGTAQERFSIPTAKISVLPVRVPSGRRRRSLP